jgi:hypothetical protein
VIKSSPEGKILKIKEGYNPNSSSVGSQIPNLFYLISSAGAITIFLIHYFHKYKERITDDVRNDKDKKI